MSGMLANLVGAASAALNLRSKEAAGRSADAPRDGKFASALNAALSPRERARQAADAEATNAAGAEGAGSAAHERASAARAEAAEAGAAKAMARRDAAREDALRADTDGAAEAGEAAARVRRGASEASARESSAADEKAEDAAAAADAGNSAAGPGPVPRSPTAVVSDVNALDPEFRTRLERVIQRMETEHGHKVEIVETVRNQSRQDHLFAQGRTRPGPVVTWTRSSNHTAGRAADLMVDGTYDNPLAMVRLARIAREEGLQTLGSRDPGHVELPGGVRVERVAVGADPSASLLRANNPAELSQAARAATVQGAAFVPNSGVARVAQVAQVAQPAQVAQVATVARVATPGPIGGGRGPDAPSASPAPAVPGQLAAAAAGASGAGGASGRGDQGAGGEGGREGHSRGESEADLSATAPHMAGASHTGAESRTTLAGPGEARGAAGAFGAEAAERIARVLQLQDAAPSRPLSQMVLRLDNAVGGEDRIRVDLRGGSVGAALSVGDPVVAARMHAELGQLQKALEGRGLQAEHLSVTAAVGGREMNEAMRSALPGDAGQRSGSDPDSGRGGWNGRSGGRSDERGSENPRQRPRRNPQEGRNT